MRRGYITSYITVCVNLTFCYAIAMGDSACEGVIRDRKAA